MSKNPIKINWQLIKVKDSENFMEPYSDTGVSTKPQADKTCEWVTRTIQSNNLSLVCDVYIWSKLIEIEYKSRTPNLMGTEPNDDKNFKKISTCLDPASKELTSGNILDDSGEFLKQLFLGCYLLYSIWHIASAFGLSLYMLIQHSHSCCK